MKNYTIIFKENGELFPFNVSASSLTDAQVRAENMAQAFNWLFICVDPA